MNKEGDIVLEFILGMSTNTSLLLFGVFASAAILRIPFSRKNILVLLNFCIAVNGIQFVCYKQYGLDGALWLYPIITHITSPFVIWSTL